MGAFAVAMRMPAWICAYPLHDMSVLVRVYVCEPCQRISALREGS
jgi:hypothetical protein